MVSGIAVRRAEARDSAAIAALVKGLGHALSPGQVADNLAELDREGLPQFLAERAGVVVGLVGLDRMTPLYRPMSVARITILIVDEACRGQGIGRMLVDHAIAQARAWGCGIIELTSNHRLEAAHRFYAHLGFEETSRRYALTL